VTVEEQDQEEELEQGYVPFSMRFKAWWEGVEVEDLVRLRPRFRAGPAAVIEIDNPDQPDPVRNWPKTRLDIVNRLWGKGFIYPGGRHESIRIVAPMNPDPSKTILDLTAGLGGGTRAICDHYGIWLTGMEPDDELAQHGHALSVEAEYEKKAPISAVDLSNLDLPPNRFDGIMIRERLYCTENKLDVLKAMDGALKSRGHLIFTDLVLSDDAKKNKNNKALHTWMRAEGAFCEPWTISKYRITLGELNMEARVFKDESDEYRSQILGAWRNFVDTLNREEMSREFVDTLMYEAHNWLRVVRALETGDLRYLRVHAIHMGPRTLSDW